MLVTYDGAITGGEFWIGRAPVMAGPAACDEAHQKARVTTVFLRHNAANGCHPPVCGVYLPFLGKPNRSARVIQAEEARCKAGSLYFLNAGRTLIDSHTLN
jgi:hypothetical protein